jgi:hypothetical protein
VAEVGLALFAGDLGLDELWMASARARATPAPEEAPEGKQGEEQEVLTAAEATVDLSVKELMRERLVVEKVKIRTPRMTIVRRPDGSTNVGDLGGEAPEEEAGKEEEEKGPLDWVETAVDWYKKIQKWREKLPGGKDAEKEEKGEKEEIDYYAREIRYPFNERPRVVVEEIVAEDLEVQFKEEDEPGSDLLPRLRQGLFRLTGLSSRPAQHASPIQLELGGELGGDKIGWAAFGLEGTLDVTGKGEPHVALDVGAKGLPPGVIESFIGESLAVSLDRGRVDLEVKLNLSLADGAGRFIEPFKPTLRFHGMRLAAKDPSRKVAGFPAEDFVKAFNEASSALSSESEPIEIADLEIGGSLTSPEFRWGDTVKNLVLQGGKAFARKQLKQAEDLAQKEAAKLGKKVEKEVERAIGDSEAGKEAKKAIENVLPAGGEKSAEEAAKKVFDVFK